MDGDRGHTSGWSQPPKVIGKGAFQNTNQQGAGTEALPSGCPLSPRCPESHSWPSETRQSNRRHGRQWQGPGSLVTVLATCGQRIRHNRHLTCFQHFPFLTARSPFMAVKQPRSAKSWNCQQAIPTGEKEVPCSEHSHCLYTDSKHTAAVAVPYSLCLDVTPRSTINSQGAQNPSAAQPRAMLQLSRADATLGWGLQRPAQCQDPSQGTREQKSVQKPHLNYTGGRVRGEVVRKAHHTI